MTTTTTVVVVVAVVVVIVVVDGIYTSMSGLALLLQPIYTDV